MDDRERYLFDLQGYIYIPGLLSSAECMALCAAAKEAEQHALACRDESPRKQSKWGTTYWHNEALGYYAGGEAAEGKTLLIEDFWLQSPVFDLLIGHEPTLSYVRTAIQGPIAITNSEIRIRYPGNHTAMHMGYPQGHAPKYCYRVVNGEINCMMVRMVYFIHDVPLRGGPMCFIPGSHKGAFHLPDPDADPIEEPGVVGIPAKAGDAIFFTEACRHGGLNNHSKTTRYTLHVGYGPDCMPSQNISTMDEPPNVTPAFIERLSPEQRALFRIHA